MPSISGFSELQLIQKRRDHNLYRARKEEDGRPVLLKKALAAQGNGSVNNRLIHEYNLLKSMHTPAVPEAMDKFYDGESQMLVLSDFDGIWLAEAIRDARIDIPSFLRLGIKLAESIAAIHRAQIIHNALNPENILVNLARGEVKILNFGNASLLSVEAPRLFNSTYLDSSLPYISPEQTGRMNRSVDYRSDFYALGAVLYEILIGHPPFRSRDPLEMVHSHIARIPPSPTQKNGEIPEMISEIVMKLLAKNAEDRYQSINGLKADLEECLLQWTKKERIDSFPVGRHDEHDVFNLPQKLYGREEEIKILSKVFDDVVSGHTRFVTVSGYSGIGKTALVNEIYKPLTQYRGYFTSGKFDQLNRETPYFSILEAFRRLLKQILTEKESRIAGWKSSFEKKLGSNIRVIIDVIPELEFITGPQPPLQPLPAQESRNRFNRVFKNFLEIFAEGSEHPLVLFLDDVQWADRASLEIIRQIVEDYNNLSLLLICAYRDNHVDAHHPLSLLLNDLEKRGFSVTPLRLKPLLQKDVTQLVADALYSEPEKTAPLAALVFEKTQGNPFFVRQFMTDIYEKKWLYRNDKGPGWSWNSEAIRKLGISENVVELMAGKLKALPGESRRVILLASCIGNTFDLKTLGLIAGMPVTRVATHLWVPLKQGLLMALDDSYKFIFESGADSEPAGVDTTVSYRFLHDRVQQAAYDMLPLADREEVHYKIGRQFLESMNEEQTAEHIYDIIHHLNLSGKRAEESTDKMKLAALNLQAGEKAKRSAAFEAAYQYFTTAARLLGDAWQTAYELCWKLYRELSETEYITGRFDDAESHFDLVIRNTESNVEKARIYITKVRLYTHINKVDEALTTGRFAARLLDINIPANPTRLQVAREFVLAKIRLFGRKPADLYNLPEMTNPGARAAIDLISHMLTAAYFTGPEMIGLLNLKMMRLVLKHGNPDSASHVYSQYGLLVGAGSGQYEEAYQFGQLALRLADEKNMPYWKSKTYLAMGAIINHWRRPMADNLPILREAWHSAQESGDLLYALYANSFTIHSKVSMGVELKGLQKEIERFLDYSQKIRHTSLDLLAYHKMISELTGPGEQDSYDFEDEGLLAEIREARDLSAEVQFFICRLKNAFFRGDYEQARAFAEDAEKVQHGAFGQLMELEYRFYTALTLIFLFRQGSRKQHRTIKAHLKKLKAWAENCPENYKHHYQLVRNEYARVSGNDRFDARHYDEAISAAASQQNYPVAALACERAVSWYLERRQQRVAFMYLLECLRFCGQWGAGIVQERFKEKYKDLLDMAPAISSGLEEAGTAAKGQGSISSALDIDTILKASQTLSSEIRLERLLENIMRIVLANAGAERAVFLLLEKEALLVKATCRAKDEAIETLQNMPVTRFNEIPQSVVRFVQNTAESVLLADAGNEGDFTSDAYIKENRVKSMLAMAVRYKGSLKGVLYLENNLTTHAFSRQRIELLEMLSNEMAISIENALLYTELQDANKQLAEYSKSLEEKVQKRTEDLQRRSEDLAQANSQLQDTLSRLRQTQDQLVQSEKLVSLGQLTAGIAHELKNPLNFVANFSEVSAEYVAELEDLLQKESLTEEAAEEVRDLTGFLRGNMEKISSHSKRADGIIRSMMLHARGSSGQQEETDINRLVREAMNLVYHGLRAQIPEFNVDLQSELDDKLPQIRALPQDLSRVFLNTINNACYAAWERHKEKGGGAIVKLSSELKDNAILVHVYDNGTGISKEMRDKIFTPFHTSKPTGSGTGLGLSISHDIIKAHGGSITFESKENDHTTFTISLPLADNPS